MRKHMSMREKGFKYCKVCKKAFDQNDHLVEHEDSHITSGKGYECTEKLPNNTLCGCKCKAHGSLQTHMNNAHQKKLSQGSYTKNEKVTWETLEEYKALIATKDPVGMYLVTDAPQK